MDGLPIRLRGVATPEEGEPVGGAATKAMREMALGQQIRCVPICYNEGRDLGAVIVEAGLAGVLTPALMQGISTGAPSGLEWTAHGAEIDER